MDVEVIIDVAAVSSSGAARGIGATILTQWIHRKLAWRAQTRPQLLPPEVSALKGDVEDMTRAVVDLNERLEFQERLAGISVEPEATLPR